MTKPTKDTSSGGSVPSRPAGLRMGKRIWFFHAFGGHLLWIGRSEQRCQIHVRDDCMSLIHAKVDCADSTFILHDHHSTNGIWADGLRVESHIELRVGMLLRLGRSELAVVDSKGTCPFSVRTFSELARVSSRVYGSHPAAADIVGSGKSREFIRRLALPKRLR